METSSMETDEIVVENPIAEPVETDGVVPVEVSETRVEPPEMEKPPVQQVNMLDLTKLSPEVRQGYRVYIEMSADSYKNVTWPFMEPVDAEGLGLWDYHERIKEPMSFQQIGGKFNNYEYNSITEVIADIRLILENCYRYNGSDHWVSKLGHKMEKILEQKLALLNRSLRDKVSLEATMALKCDYIPAESTASEGTGRRRAAARVSYVNMINGEGSSSLLTRLKIQEDLEERERRRVRDKEKKEANLVLLQDLAEWEEKELGADVVKQLHSMWEIPSLAGLLFLLKDFLYIQDLSITELELSFVYASKSSLLARIFTALLITPHQRKSLFKKPPMKFKVWESKLCDRLNSWYKIIEKDGQVFTCHHLGLDMASFEMLGEVNPLLEKSYMDLTLHQRVWILKCLCDNSLVRDYDLREHLSSIAPTDQRDMYLGCDADSWSYLYFPIFSSSGLRIYKQCPLEVPTLSKRKKKVSPPPPPVATKPKRTPARPATPTQPRRNARLRKLRSDTPSPEPETPPPPSPPPVQEEEEQEPVNTIPEGFELAALDVESLKLLSEKFAEPPPPPKKRGRRSKPPPPRKRCEVELHRTLLALLEELEQYEMSFSRHMSKAKIKIMKESQEPDPVDEPEEVVPAEEAEEWGSEESIGDEIEDAGAQNMSSDEDFVLDDEENKNKTPAPTQTTEDGEKKGNVATQGTLPQKRKADEENIIEKSKQSVASPGVNDDDDDPCSIAIQTAPPRFKKKKKKHSPVSELKTTAVCQTVGTVVPQPVGTVVPQSALNKTPQGTKNILHIPSGLQAAKEMKAVTAKSSASVNTTMSASSSVTTSAVSVSRAVSSTSTTQAVKNTSAVRIHPPKRPAILGSSTSAAAKPRPLVVVPSSQACSATSVQAVAASKNLQSTAVTLTQAKLLQSQASLSAALPAGVGKVMLVSSSGVPLQVLKTIPVSQSMIQGKTLSPSVLTTPGNTRVRIVSSSSSPSNPVGVVKLPSSSPLSKPATSQLPSSASAKVAVSVAQKLSNVLTTAKQAGNISASSASPAHPPVLLVQRAGAGGVVPLTVKGGTIVMPASSSSQQLVVIRPSSALTSSTTSTTTLLSGAGISVLGNAQIAQTALGPKVILQAPTSLGPKTATVTGNKPVVQAAKVSRESKPAQLKTASQTISNKPVIVTTTALPSIITTNKTATTTVTTASQSTLLATKAADSKTTCPALPVGNEQVVLGTVMYSELTARNKQLSNVGSIPVCGTQESGAVMKTLVSNCDAVKGTVTQTEANVSPDTKTVLNVSADTKREANVSVTQTMVNVLPDTERVASSSHATPTAATVSQGTPTVLLDTQKVANVLQDSQTVSTSLQDIRTVASTSPDTRTLATVSQDIPSFSGDSQKGASVLQDTQTVGTLPDTQTVGTSLPDMRTVATTSPDTLKVATASPDTQMPATVSSETGLKQTSVTCEDKSIPAVTINTSQNCQPENISDEHCNKAAVLDTKDTTNGCDPLLDLTCYETSVSDSAGCEESDDSAPNGLHPDLKTVLPCKLTDTDVKLHNGTVCTDSKREEKELDSVEQGHEVTKQNTNGNAMNETLKQTEGQDV